MRMSEWRWLTETECRTGYQFQNANLQISTDSINGNKHLESFQIFIHIIFQIEQVN